MRREPLEQARPWLDQAWADLKVAEGLETTAPFAACFHAQQAAEKALKAVYVAHGLPFPWTHSVQELLRSAAQEHPELEAFVEGTLLLDSFYTGTRYPSLGLASLEAPEKRYAASHARQAISTARPMVEAGQRIWEELVRRQASAEGKEEAGR